MAKKKASSYMTPGEQIAGVVLLVVYLIVLPLAAEPMLHVLGGLLGTTFSAAARSLIYYGLLFVVTLLIFHQFLGRTTRNLANNLGTACRSALVSFVALYGLNELAYRLTRLIAAAGTNLNDAPISAQVWDAPRVTQLIIVFLAPFVEEALFRGLVFGNLKHKSRAAAYLVSCLLFALLHTWQFAVVSPDVTHFLLLMQYLVPGAVLAWAYESSGTLWTAIAVHAAANALNLWMMF